MIGGHSRKRFPWALWCQIRVTLVASGPTLRSLSVLTITIRKYPDYDMYDMIGDIILHCTLGIPQNSAMFIHDHQYIPRIWVEHSYKILTLNVFWLQVVENMWEHSSNHFKVCYTGTQYQSTLKTKNWEIITVGHRGQGTRFSESVILRK